MPTARRHSCGSHQSRGEKQAAMARKREERAVHRAYKKEKKAQKNAMEEENFYAFHAQLAKMELQLREIPGDGYVLVSYLTSFR